MGRLLDVMDIGERSKMSVRRVLAVIASKCSEPYGTHLLLDTTRVIKAIESFKVSGRTMLSYFVSVIRVLKEMAFAEVPNAGKSRVALQKYKDINYQHFSVTRKGEAKGTSKLRKMLLVEENKEAFQTRLLKVM